MLQTAQMFKIIIWHFGKYAFFAFTWGDWYKLSCMVNIKLQLIKCLEMGGKSWPQMVTSVYHHHLLIYIKYLLLMFNLLKIVQKWQFALLEGFGVSNFLVVWQMLKGL